MLFGKPANLNVKDLKVTEPPVVPGGEVSLM